MTSGYPYRAGEKTSIVPVLALLLLLALNPSTHAAEFSEDAKTLSSMPWWLWSLSLFVLCIFLGILAVLAGMGGAILYVPIVSVLSPFHLDFVRGAGLVVTLAGSIGASPRLLKTGMASLRLALPLAFFSSVGSLIGANAGLALPPKAVKLVLGVIIIAVVVLMLFTKNIDCPPLRGKNPLAGRMKIGGIFVDGITGNSTEWGVRRIPLGLITFFIIGLIGGVFGLGSGWANVPTLNLLLGAPLKIAVATSVLIIAITSSAASWVFINQGAIVPIIVVPSMAGIMLGTRIGARLLPRISKTIVRYFVLGILILAALLLLLEMVWKG